MDAIRDKNRVPVWFGLSSVDGVTPTLIKVNSLGQMAMEIGTFVSAVITVGTQIALRDMNHLTCHGGVSNADASIFIPLSVNPATGAVLAQTT